MSNKAIDYIKDYLYESNLQNSLFIDVENINDYNETIKELDNINIKRVNLSSFCVSDDTTPNIENFYENLGKNDKEIIVLGFSQYFKFIGNDKLLEEISIAASKSLKNKCIFLLFQSKDVLNEICKNDLRFRQRCKICDGISGNLSFKIYREFLKIKNCYLGFKNMLFVLEQSLSDYTYRFCTSLNKKLFERHSYSLSLFDSYYDCIVDFDKSITTYAKENFMDSDEWEDIYNQTNKFGSLNELYNYYFGENNRYNSYQQINSNKKLTNLYLLSLREKDEKHYLNYIANKITKSNEFLKSIYLFLLDIPLKNTNFSIFYNERKALCSTFNSGATAGHINDYCKYAVNKGIDGIHYLTSNTEIERKSIIELITKNEFNNNVEIINTIKDVYSDLSCYLTKSYFTNSLLDSYFDAYKFCKITNRISEQMLEMVNQQAKKREFNRILPTRIEIVEKQIANNDYVIFTDAMGVEFLSFILKKCSEYQMNANVFVARANLPTLTSYNKDFRFDYNYKKLDELKHHPDGDYNYDKTKLPIHIPKELELVNELLKIAIDKLSTYNRVALISDHGASRLAVIYDSKIIDSGSEGIHCGRCCLNNNVTRSIENATEDNNYYCMADYNRFKGSRAPEIEVHGGATLEEIAVPIIILTRNKQSIDVRVITQIIKVSYKEKAKLILEASVKLNNPYVVINNNRYDAINNCEIIEFMLNDIKKPGSYKAILYDGGNQIGNEVEFTIESKVSSDNKLF